VRVEKVDHVAIAVRSLEAASRLFIDTLGGEFISGGDSSRRPVRTLQLRLAGTKIELIQSVVPDTYVDRFIAKHGEGFHHMTILVDDIHAAVARLAADGYETVDLDDSTPAWSEAYVRPRSGFGTLIQLAQTDQGWDGPYPGVTRETVLAGDCVWQERGPVLRDSVVT
jgi:methylmalonyl-CoA/ethylmalonyl-CoA epimerase